MRFASHPENEKARDDETEMGLGAKTGKRALSKTDEKIGHHGKSQENLGVQKLTRSFIKK